MPRRVRAIVRGVTGAASGGCRRVGWRRRRLRAAIEGIGRNPWEPPGGRMLSRAARARSCPNRLTCGLDKRGEDEYEIDGIPVSALAARKRRNKYRRVPGLED